MASLKNQKSLKKLVNLYGSRQYPENDILKSEIQEQIRQREIIKRQKLKRKKVKEESYKQSLIEQYRSQNVTIDHNDNQFDIDNNHYHNQTTMYIKPSRTSLDDNQSNNQSQITLLGNLRSTSQINFMSGNYRSRQRLVGGGTSNHGISTSMDLSRSSLGFKSEFKPKSYHNVTGPGDYDIPSYTGYQSIVAGRRNGPQFTFGHRAKKIQYFSKEYLRVFYLHFDLIFQNFMGKESEDAGFNIIHADMIKPSEPKVSIPRDPRFKEPSVVRYKGQLQVINLQFYDFCRPVAYQSFTIDDKQQEQILQQYKSIGMGYGKRSDFTIQPQLIENPGPADYDQTNKNIFKRNDSDQSLNKSKMIGDGSVSVLQSVQYQGSASKLPGITMSKAKRDIDHYSKNMYTKNMDYRLMGQDSPGPAGYHSVIDNSWSQQDQQNNSISRNVSHKKFTIPRQKRHLSDVKVITNAGPQTYDTLSVFNKRNTGPVHRGVKIGSQTRDYDPMKYSHNNRILVVKGLY